MKIVKIFEQVPDFRTEKKVYHLLSDILISTLCAVLSGADDFEEIAEYSREKEEFLCTFLEFKNGIPSHDTYRRVFIHLDTAAFERCLVEYSEEIIKELEDRQINIDGKILKATGKRGKKNSAICIVSAWASEHCLSLGQSKVDKKSNEKTAIPQIIETVDVTDALVSIDAMGCDTKIATLIRSNGGDYLLALKKNQKNLYEEVHDWMLCFEQTLESDEQTDYVGGRIEKRTTYVCNDLTYIDESQKWMDSKSIIMIKSERHFKSGLEKASTKIRFFISSKLENAKYFAERIRKHWSIENQLHWYLDVVFKEDKQRLKQGNAPENMAVMRKLALQSLLKNKGRKSMKTFRKKIAWNEDLLVDVLLNF
ncbi:MAG: ISAs1 family transposase [Bacteroidota bacterium]